MDTGNRMTPRDIKTLLLLLSVLVSNSVAGADTSIRITPGPVNSVVIERNGHVLVVYGDPSGTVENADMVLLTHNRRDVVWAAQDLATQGTKLIVPAAEAGSFADASAFWDKFVTARFHDYQQQTTKLPIAAMPIDRAVQEGDTIAWQDLSLRVIATPGYTRGAVSYVADIDGTRYAFVGDTIYGDGHLLDLYSLQDAVAGTKVGGYHGYAGRIGPLLDSLRHILTQKPDVLVPARGPVIRNPQVAIAKLVDRLQAAYRNYLAISAGHYYFTDSYEQLAERALGKPHNVPWQPYSTTIEDSPPTWMIPIHNSRLLLSDSGAGWLIDCGSQAIINELVKLRDAGRLTSLEGLFITHYHDDHTEKIDDLLEVFPCPVYVTPLMESVTRHPEVYRLPAMTARPVSHLTTVPDRFSLRWREFQLTFYDYPGQTLYHSAVLAERDNGGKLFFLGDSFTPSGIDDYCLLNRNLMHEGNGYLLCLDILEELPADCLLVNEHVGPAFRFDRNQLDHMRDMLVRRRSLLAELFPWDDANYGIDERWARFCPYGQSVQPGQTVTLAVRILSHSDRPHEYTVTPHVPSGFQIKPTQAKLMIDPGQETPAVFRVTIPASAASPVAVVTADVAFDEWDLRHWCEAIIALER